MEEEKTEINPADYFSPDGPVPARGFLRDIYYPTVLGGIGVAIMAFVNLSNRKPAFSGLQQHVIAGTLGVMLGFGTDKWQERRAAERDTALYQYMVAHPEDFSTFRRKKYAEVMERWVPIR